MSTPIGARCINKTWFDRKSEARQYLEERGYKQTRTAMGVTAFVDNLGIEVFISRWGRRWHITK